VRAILYLIDANIIITAKDSYYAMDQVPEFWDWLVHQGRLGNIKIPSEIWEEVSPGPNKEDPFYLWRKDKTVAEALVLDEELNESFLHGVIKEGYQIEEPTEDDLETMRADPFLVAYALNAENRCVVTNEVSKPSRTGARRKLPDVCNNVSVKCYNTFQLTRLLDFSTSWR